MRDLRHSVWLVLAVWFLFGANRMPGEELVSTQSFTVVCTTTHLSSIVEALAGEQVDVHTIIPFGMCPGHFDLTPGEAQALRNADLLLYHGFERFLKGVALSPAAVAVQQVVGGNWMIPSIHTQAVQYVGGILADRRPDFSAAISSNSIRYTTAVCRAADAVRQQMQAYAGVPVICADMNRDMVEWFGLDVIATYPRDEEVSVKSMHDILVNAKAANVKLVIDNRQSSGKVGQTMARELGVPCVVLSNFPIDSSLPHDDYAYVVTLAGNCTDLVTAFAADKVEPLEF